jgi:hypothetical protein
MDGTCFALVASYTELFGIIAGVPYSFALILVQF